jgi:hypothetical protein
MMTNYIFKKPNSIPDLLCDHIISLFENGETKFFDGVTFGGIQKDVKNTKDYIINKNEEKWSKISEILYKELSKGLKEYLLSLHNDQYNKENNMNRDFSFFDNNALHIDNFMVQRYIANEGHYVYHNDFHADNNRKRYRVITYIWYLNDVCDGGETEFWGEYKIKPKKGQLLLFPASWCFPHTGRMPLSNNKYIITGWFYYNS